MLRVNGACIGSIGVAAALAVCSGSASTAHAGQIAATPAQDNAAPTFNAIRGVRETTNRLLAQLAPTTTPADLATLDVNILTTIDALGLTVLRLAPDADAETVARAVHALNPHARVVAGAPEHGAVPDDPQRA